MQRPERLYSSNSTILDSTLERMETVRITNNDVKFTNYSTSAGNNTLELLFSLENNPTVNEDSQLVVRVPTGFNASSNLTCLHLFTNQNLGCNSSNGTITVRNVFKP